MIFKEAIANINIEAIEKALKKFHFRNEFFEMKKYIDLLELLKGASIVPSENFLTLHVEYVEDYGNSEHIWTASYSLHKRYKQKYLLSFASINEIANALILEEEIENLDEYVAHILWGYLCSDYIDEEDSEYQAEDKEI